MDTTTTTEVALVAVKVFENKEWSDIQKSINAMYTHEARVGWFEKDVYPETGEPVASVAVKQEFGFVTQLPGTNKVAIVPPRPFIRPAITKNKSLIDKYIDNNFKKVLDGSNTVEFALKLVSQLTRDLIQTEIKNLHEPALSAYTIAQRLKKRKSKVVTDAIRKPLIDTGHMFKTVNYTVTKL